MNLETMRQVIVEQAKKKEWNNTTEFLAHDKIVEEFLEFISAVRDKDAVQMAREWVDFSYIALQIIENFDKDHEVDLDDQFAYVYNYNWHHKKKTQDDKGNLVRK